MSKDVYSILRGSLQDMQECIQDRMSQLVYKNWLSHQHYMCSSPPMSPTLEVMSTSDAVCCCDNSSPVVSVFARQNRAWCRQKNGEVFSPSQFVRPGDTMASPYSAGCVLIHCAKRGAINIRNQRHFALTMQDMRQFLVGCPIEAQMKALDQYSQKMYISYSQMISDNGIFPIFLIRRDSGQENCMENVELRKNFDRCFIKPQLSIFPTANPLFSYLTQFILFKFLFLLENNSLFI